MPRVRAADAFIAAFLIAQALLPLRWYLGFAPAGDERFAWRMFSRQHHDRCEGAFFTDGRVVDLRREVAPGWPDLLSRGRGAVIAPVAAHLCGGADRVTLALTCRDVFGNTWELGDGITDLCAR